MGVIDDYTQNALVQYAKTALWSSTDDDDNPLDEWSEVNDFTREAWLDMRGDVADFVQANWEDVKSLDASQVGHDFWLTRNRHGAGFWDRGLGELGDKLTSAAHVYSSSYLWQDDNGNIHTEG